MDNKSAKRFILTTTYQSQLSSDIIEFLATAARSFHQIHPYLSEKIINHPIALENLNATLFQLRLLCQMVLVLNGFSASFFNDVHCGVLSSDSNLRENLFAVLVAVVGKMRDYGSAAHLRSFAETSQEDVL
jgi:hypothetical protein